MAVADALESLLHWHGVTKRAAWRHLADVRAGFPHADAVDAFTVFNVSGNKYKLVSVIKYRWQIVYIRHILTHAEYDKAGHGSGSTSHGRFPNSSDRQRS